MSDLVLWVILSVLIFCVLFMTWRLTKLIAVLEILKAEIYVLRLLVNQKATPPKEIPFVEPHNAKKRTEEQRAKMAQKKKEWWAKKKASGLTTSEAQTQAEILSVD